MSLKTWESNGWLRKHQTGIEEIQNLFEIVERDLRDSSNKQLSADWRFGIAYNATLKLCTILLFVSGYRSERNQAHYRTIQAVPLILGKDLLSDADYLNTCRIKRNETEYDFAGGISDSEASELIQFANEFREKVKSWLRLKHPNLIRE